MIRGQATVVLAVLGVVLVSLPAVAVAQDASGAPDPSPPASPPPARLHIILNGAFWLGGNPTFGDTRRIEEYAEQTTIRTSYQTQSAVGPDVAVQGALPGGFGVRVGYSFARREQTGMVDVSRPHPLYFDRPREASAEVAGLGYSESALHLDLAFGKSVGSLYWSLFGGFTLFRVEADMLGEPTYTEVYPFDELVIDSTPTVTAESRSLGFNLGGGLDYRFGRSGRFGLGLQLLYSAGDVELQATSEAEASTFKAGGVQVAAGVRVYF